MGFIKEILIISGGYVSWFVTCNQDFYLIQLLLAARRRINRAWKMSWERRARWCLENHTSLPSTIRVLSGFHSPQIPGCQTDSSNSRSKIISLNHTFFPSSAISISFCLYAYQTHYWKLFYLVNNIHKISSSNLLYYTLTGAYRSTFLLFLKIILQIIHKLILKILFALKSFLGSVIYSMASDHEQD